MWHKLGNIYNKEAQLPTIHILNNGKIRIFFSKRINGISVINFFETDQKNPSKIVYENKIPIFSQGLRGCFDDMGVMPSCVCDVYGENILFYTGWNIQKGCVPYGHGIGSLVISNSEIIKRNNLGPILDRTLQTPFLVNSAFVFYENNKYNMLFCNGNGWEDKFPTYHLSKAISFDCKNWKDIEDFLVINNCAMSRPCKHDNAVWFSIKYKNTPYEIYVYENKVLSKEKFYGNNEDWDSEMMCYPYVFNIGNKKYMYYNGNKYGQTGIGLAEWI